jgi:hypothetical protein
MERRKGNQRLQPGHDLGADPDRRGELGAAVHHAMADRDQRSPAAVLAQPPEQEIERLPVLDGGAPGS